MATEVIKVIDPDSGSGYDYDSLYDWEAAEQGDLTGARDEIAIATCRCTGGTADTTAVTIDGWTTSATQYIKIWTDPAESYRHSGKYEAGNKYRLAVDGNCIRNLSAYKLVISGLQLSVNYSGSGNRSGIEWDFAGTGTVSSEIIVDDCIIRYAGTATGSCYGVNNLADASIAAGSGLLLVRNTIIYGFTPSTASRAISLSETDYYAYIYNCTISESDVGIYRGSSGPVTTAKNCAVFNNADDFSGTITIDYCASDDGDGTNAVDISPGAIEADDWAACFTDYANGDFSLKSASVCVNAGTNLYDAATYPFQDDIIGTDRGGSGASWDIGASEYVAAAGGIVIPIFLRQYKARRN